MSYKMKKTAKTRQKRRKNGRKRGRNTAKPRITGIFPHFAGYERARRAGRQGAAAMDGMTILSDVNRKFF